MRVGLQCSAVGCHVPGSAGWSGALYDLYSRPYTATDVWIVSCGVLPVMATTKEDATGKLAGTGLVAIGWVSYRHSEHALLAKQSRHTTLGSWLALARLCTFDLQSLASVWPCHICFNTLRVD